MLDEVIAKLEELGVEELKEVITAAQRILSEKVTTSASASGRNVRVFIPASVLGDARKSTVRPHARLVLSVDSEKTNFFAFEGKFLPKGKEVDLPLGSIVIIVSGDGSWRHPHSTAFVCRAEEVKPEDAQKQASDFRLGGKLVNLRILEAFDATSQFLSLRDYVASLL